MGKHHPSTEKNMAYDEKDELDFLAFEIQAKAVYVVSYRHDYSNDGAWRVFIRSIEAAA